MSPYERRWSALLLLAALSIGCHRDADASRGATEVASSPAPSSPPPVEAAPLTTGIAWELVATPSATFPMAKRGDFELWIVAHNLGPGVQDTARDRLAYRVNGKESMMLAMAFGNGGREREWSALPPGKTLREARGGSTDPSFGQSLFPAPGDYHLTIEELGRLVAALDVHVSP